MDNDILEYLPDAILLLNSDREIIDANQAARDLLSPGFKGRDLALSLRHPDILKAVDAALKGQAPDQCEISFSHPISRTFEMRTSRLPEADGPGQDVVVVLILHDITAAIQAVAVRSDFVANVSHELRSPLAALVGFIETLQGAARNDAQAREYFLSIMSAEADRMTRLIDDLLSLSALEVNEHVRPQGQVDLKKILQVVTELLLAKAEVRSMAIKLICQSPVEEVPGDSDELIQVFQNLIDNAIKYGASGSVITLTLKAVDRIPDIGVPGIAVAVHNEGEGVASEYLPRLTERFYRVDKGRSRSMGGTGLGLAIVKHIVSHHRGRLMIQSASGKGSTFTVYLPTSSAG